MTQSRGSEISGFKAGNPEVFEFFNTHVEKYVGQIKTVLHEAASDSMHIDVHVVEPTPEQNFYTCITSGMSDFPMSAPEGMEEASYVELLVCLPSDWQISQKAFIEDEHQHYWPIRWLKNLSRYPHHASTWLWLDHTIPNGDPPDKLGSNTDMCCIMLGLPILFPVEFFQLSISEEKSISFLMLTPIHNREMEHKLEHGSADLWQKFMDLEPEGFINPGRQCVL